MDMRPVLQSHLPSDYWTNVRSGHLPGIQPIKLENWLTVDEAYAGQMALRDRLIADRPADVLAISEIAIPAAQELLELVLAVLKTLTGFLVEDETVSRPDGVLVRIDRSNPLACVGKLIQEDMCLMQAADTEHVLSGAVLCFPAGWTLSEKIGRPLSLIHAPVNEYGSDLARRVQRMFDNIRVDHPLTRNNGFFYESPSLFTPFTEGDPRPKMNLDAPYFRVEKQCLLRLPRSQAVVFSIHTYMVEKKSLTDTQIGVIRQVLG